MNIKSVARLWVSLLVISLFVVAATVITPVEVAAEGIGIEADCSDYFCNLWGPPGNPTVCYGIARYYCCELWCCSSGGTNCYCAAGPSCVTECGWCGPW